MGLVTPTLPTEAVAAIHAAFQPLVETASFRLPSLRGATGPLALSQPHQVFTLGLSDLLAGNGLNTMRPTGWRYLIQDGDNALAAAEAVSTGAGDEHVFSTFNEGPFVASTAAALKSVQGLPQVAAGSFEPRLLHVPAIHAMGLWLHNAEAGNDLVVPLAPSPIDSPAGQAIPIAQYLQEVAAKAAAVASVGPSDLTGG